MHRLFIVRHDVRECRDADNRRLHDEDPLAVGANAGDTRFVHIGLLGGVTVATIVHVGALEPDAQMGYGVQRAQVDHRLVGVDDDGLAKIGIQVVGQQRAAVHMGVQSTH